MEITYSRLFDQCISSITVKLNDQNKIFIDTFQTLRFKFPNKNFNIKLY